MNNNSKNFEDVNVDVADIRIMESLIIKDITDETPKIIFTKNNSKITQNDGKEELNNERNR